MLVRDPRAKSRADLARLGRAAAAVLALVLVAAGCADDGQGDAKAQGQQVSQTRYVAGNGAVTTVPPDEREPAPELAGRDLDGDRIALSDYAGKIVVLNVWGSWCPPCRKEAPELARAARHLADSGVAFLGINTRDNDRGPARAFVRTFDVPYPSVYDPKGELLLGFRGTLPASAIPSTLVIDGRGRVAGRVIGAVTYDTIVGLVEDVRVKR